MIVLVSEDDDFIRAGLVEILEDEGYSVVEAENGEAAIALFNEVKPQFVILDVMMPGLSGYDVCRAIRQTANTPILFLSAKAEEVDRVLGLELGGDDYIVKPFGVHELVSRIRAITRRCYGANEESQESGAFVIDTFTIVPSELRGYSGDNSVELSLREVKILRLFSQHPGQVIDRDKLFNECWGMNYFPNSRTLDQHISKLRRKLSDDPKNPRVIETVHGVGYRYAPNE